MINLVLLHSTRELGHNQELGNNPGILSAAAIHSQAVVFLAVLEEASGLILISRICYEGLEAVGEMAVPVAEILSNSKRF